jgi:hypothetical protein
MKRVGLETSDTINLIGMGLDESGKRGRANHLCGGDRAKVPIMAKSPDRSNRFRHR